MTILDANILLYAYDIDSPRHAESAHWVNQLFQGPEQIGIPWVTIWAFLRVRTNPRLGVQARTLTETMSIVREWTTLPGVSLITPGPQHASILESMIAEGQATGPLVSDAVLAALAVEHGAALASTDRDFSRFPRLRWVNPLTR